jgi:hypothetical protein
MTTEEKVIHEKIDTINKAIEYLEEVKEVLFKQLDEVMEKNGTVNGTSSSS